MDAGCGVGGDGVEAFVDGGWNQAGEHGVDDVIGDDAITSGVAGFADFGGTSKKTASTSAVVHAALFLCRNGALSE